MNQLYMYCLFVAMRSIILICTTSYTIPSPTLSEDVLKHAHDKSQITTNPTSLGGRGWRRSPTLSEDVLKHAHDKSQITTNPTSLGGRGWRRSPTLSEDVLKHAHDKSQITTNPTSLGGRGWRRSPTLSEDVLKHAHDKSQITTNPTSLQPEQIGLHYLEAEVGGAWLEEECDEQLAIPVL